MSEEISIGQTSAAEFGRILSNMEDLSQYSQQVSEAEANIRQEVEEITDAFKEGAETEISLKEKVDALRENLDVITEEVQSWRGKNHYLEAIEGVKSQVEEIHAEWDTLSESLTAQRERVENLLQAFPGVIETSTLKALTMRVGHLEELVHDLIQEKDSKSNSDKSRKQPIVSVAALAITIVFWGAFLGMSLLG
jgi:polyhydroxyalkanoate synthesis regulator phasin